MFFRILTALCFCLVSNTVKAELTWTPEQGWTSKNGLLSFFVDDGDGAHNGIGLMNKAKTLQEAGEYFKALHLYKRVYDNYPSSELAPEAYFQEAEIYTTRRQYAPAFTAYATILKKYGDYPKFNEVLRKQFEVACLLMEGKRPYYWGLIPGFKDYDSAIQYFEKIIDKAPFHDLAPKALMNIALIAQERGKPEQVIDALERLIYSYSKSELSEKGYILLAKTYASLVQSPDYDQAPTHKAYHVYEDFLETYPNSPYVAEAEAGANKALETLAASRLALGQFYYQYRNNPKAALVLYNDAVSVAPHSASAENAKASIQLIKNKVPPPKTWVDVVFGSYEQANQEEDIF